MGIREGISEYREITLEILNKVQKDEPIIELIEKRGQVTDYLIKSNFDKVEVKNIMKELKIEELDKKVQDEIEKLKLDTMIEIKKLKQRRSANDKYMNFGNQPYIFSTKR